MRQSLATDTRAASNTLVAVLLAGVVAISATAAGAIVTTQYQESLSDDTDITDAQIETPTRDQVRISSLVGDDLPLESTKVRIEFLDRNAPPAVVTDLSEGMSASNSVTVSETAEVSQPKLEPVTQNVTVKIPNGTVNKTEVPAHKWERGGKKQVTKTTSYGGDPDAEVHYVFIEYKPAKFRYSGAEWDPNDLMLIEGANGEDHATWGGDWSGVPSRFAACEAAAPDGALFNGGSWANGLGSNDYDERYPEPRDNTYPVKPGEPLSYEYTKKYPACSDLVSDLKNNNYPRASEYDGTLLVGPTQVKSPKVKETVDTTKTVVSPTEPDGDGWTKVESNVSTVTVELDSPKTTYKTETREVTVGYKEATSTTEVTRDREVYTTASVSDDVELNAEDTYSLFSGNATAGADGEVEDENSDDSSDSTVAATTTLPADAAIANANDNAAFLRNGRPNSAAGVGGTVGTTESGMMMQGDELIIQLDRPLLYDDERISVEIIDTETNTVVLDQNARVNDLSAIALAADTTNGSTGGGTGGNPSDGGSGDIGDPSFNGTLPDDSNESDGDDSGDGPIVAPPSSDGGDNSDSGDGFDDGDGEIEDGGSDASESAPVESCAPTTNTNNNCGPSSDSSGDGDSENIADLPLGDGGGTSAPTSTPESGQGSSVPPMDDPTIGESKEVGPCDSMVVGATTFCSTMKMGAQGGDFIDGALGTDVFDGEEMLKESGWYGDDSGDVSVGSEIVNYPDIGPFNEANGVGADTSNAESAGEAVKNTVGSVADGIGGLINGGDSGSSDDSDDGEPSNGQGDSAESNDLSDDSDSSSSDSGSPAGSSGSLSPCGTCGGSLGGSSSDYSYNDGDSGSSSSSSSSGSSDYSYSDGDSGSSSGSSSSGSIYYDYSGDNSGSSSSSSSSESSDSDYDYSSGGSNSNAGYLAP